MKGAGVISSDEGRWQAVVQRDSQAVRAFVYGVLTTGNCRSYLDDLPQDVDVVRVERVKRPTAQMYRVMQVA